MWKIFSSIIIFVLFLLYIFEYRKRKALQRNADILKPMIETIENIQDIVYYCETVPKLKYLYLSPSIESFLQGSLKEHLENPEIVFDIVHPEDYDTLMKKKLGTLDFTKPITVRYKNNEGNYLWFEEYATPVYKNGKFVGVMGVYRNINDNVMLQQKLEYNATHDGLTNLYNRAFFQSKINEYNECNIPIGVVIADLDDLKPVNDKYGHKMGDQLVRAAAEIFKVKSDENMIVSRYGGDEFAILMPNAEIRQVENYLKSVKDEMNQNIENLPFTPISISIGYSYSSCSYGVMDQLLSEADEKMYNNKKMKKIITTN